MDNDAASAAATAARSTLRRLPHRVFSARFMDILLRGVIAVRTRVQARAFAGRGRGERLAHRYGARRGLRLAARRGRAGIRGRRATDGDAWRTGQRRHRARRSPRRWLRGRGSSAPPGRAYGSAAASVPTVRRAGSTILRRRAPASRCRWPWQPQVESRSLSSRDGEIVDLLLHLQRRLAERFEVLRLAVAAASAAISPSTSLRALSNSKGPGPPSTPLRPLALSGPVTKMPVPTRTSTRPPISSEMIASRTDVRETPS